MRVESDVRAPCRPARPGGCSLHPTTALRWGYPCISPRKSRAQPLKLLVQTWHRSWGLKRHARLRHCPCIRP